MPSASISFEGMYPNDTVPKHLEKLDLAKYFWPDKVHYTNGKNKTEMLNKLGSTLHYDDDMEEHINNFGLKMRAITVVD